MDEQEQPHGDGLDDLREELKRPVKGMTFGRVREIRKMEQDGKLESISDAELAEYENFNASMRKTMEAMKMTDLEFITPPSLRTISADDKLFGAAERLSIPPQPMNKNAEMERLLENAVGAMTEQRIEHAKSTEQLRTMTSILGEIKAARTSADSAQNVQAKFNRRMTIAAIVIASVSLASSLIIPVLENTAWNPSDGGSQTDVTEP